MKNTKRGLLETNFIPPAQPTLPAMFHFIIFLLIWAVLAVMAFRIRLSAILAIGGSLIVAILPFFIFSKLGGLKGGSAGHTASRVPQIWHIEGDNWSGATSKELYSKLTQYTVQGDAEAYRKLYSAGLQTGDITGFIDGEEVMLADTAVFSGLMKVRRKGELQEYWTSIDAAKNE